MAGATPRVVAVVCVLAAVLAAPSVAAESATRSRTASLDTFERSIVQEMNALRRARGLKPLRLSRGLSTAADGHSRAILRTGVFAHELPGGPRVLTRLRRHYPPLRRGRWAVGENIAALSPPATAHDIVAMWLASPPHRRTLYSRLWRDVGLGAVAAESAPGVFGGEAMTVVTADFGMRR